MLRKDGLMNFQEIFLQKSSLKILYLKASEVITLMSWMLFLDIFLWYFCRHNRENLRSTDRKSQAYSTGTLSKTIL